MISRGLGLRGWLTLSGIGIAGFALGMVAERTLVQRGSSPELEWIQSEGTVEGSLQSLPSRGVFEQLELTAAQQTAVDSVLDAAQAGLDSSMTPLLREVRETVADAHAGVRLVLTDDQLVLFDSLLAAEPIIRLRTEESQP